jgi:hypothetical protein
MIQFLRTFYNYRIMSKGSKFFDRNPVVQGRFEELEDWCEELEERIVALEAIAHPKCGIESFDGYNPLVKRIEKLEENV